MVVVATKLIDSENNLIYILESLVVNLLCWAHLTTNTATFSSVCLVAIAMAVTHASGKFMCKVTSKWLLSCCHGNGYHRYKREEQPTVVDGLMMLYLNIISSVVTAAIPLTSSLRETILTQAKWVWLVGVVS